MDTTIREEERAGYVVMTDPPKEAHENAIIEHALEILRSRLAQPGVALTSPALVRDFLTLKLAGEQSEKFAVILMDAQHRVIEYSVLFHGTIDGTSVYPRELVKKALKHNAAALILAHNHPSGKAEPSSADIMLTRKLKQALELVDVRVLDHFIVGGCRSLQFCSMAETGCM